MNIGVGPKQYNRKVDVSFYTLTDALTFAQEGDVVFIFADYLLVDRTPESLGSWLERDCVHIGINN